MKEILIVSGKGGTGKTTVTASVASLAENSVFADCDVDAADLHLILKPDTIETHEFISGHTASIRNDDCISCGLCQNVCKFDAIGIKDNEYFVDDILCEGCGVCTWSCPNASIDFNQSLCGHWYVSETRFGKMVHAKLKIAAENSGKLVSVVKNKAKEIARQNNSNYVIIDGPPGIGCPVIASMTGVDSVIIVTEPTLSGLHDMKRVIDLAKHFSIDTYVCINKYDINKNVTNQIKQLLSITDISVIGLIPYDTEITSAQINGQSIVEYSDSSASMAIKDMWHNYKKINT